ESLKAGLVTKIYYMDSFFDEIDSKAGKSAKIVDPATYLYYLGIQQNEAPKSKIALIIADGSLVESKPKGPSRLAQDNVIDTDQMAQAFEDAAKDDDVKAILFRVNSPGGAPSASETIRHALVKAKEKNKPVYVSMGSVAASGGYWISMDGDKIFADPATLTGSIGVLGGKFVLGGLFDKLGITWEALSTGGDNADIFSLSKPFSPKGRERMNAMIDETYRTFTAYVAKARRLSPEKTEEVAKGRIFTGAQAVQVGLVDQLGGINDALNALKEKIGLKPEDILTVSLYPQPETPMSLALKMLEDLHFGGAMVRQYLPFLNSFTGVQGPQARLPYPYRVAE
ncbi:MAG: signal peptide peptidase SppA, partial [Bdellovibrionales bacterium]